MRPAIETWREAFGKPHQAAAAVIEADRAALVDEIVNWLIEEARISLEIEEFILRVAARSIKNKWSNR